MWFSIKQLVMISGIVYVFRGLWFVIGHEQLSLLIRRGFCWKICERCLHVPGWRLLDLFSIRPPIHKLWSKIQMLHICLSWDEAHEVSFSSLWYWIWLRNMRHLGVVPICIMLPKCIYNRYPVRDPCIRACLLKVRWRGKFFLADQNQHVSKPTDRVELQCNRHSKSTLKSVLKMAKLAPSEKRLLKRRSLIGHLYDV